MKKTPIQELINHLQETCKSSKDIISPTVLLFRLQNYLKKEKEFAHKCFIAGADYGIDVAQTVTWNKDDSTVDNFDEFYKQYEDEKSTL